MQTKIKKWFEQHLWTAEMVQTAVRKGIISQKGYTEIVTHK